MRLGGDPRKADQMVAAWSTSRTAPAKTARVIVFAAGEKAAEAEAAGADAVGSDDLVARIPGRAGSTSTPPSPPPTRWPRSAGSRGFWARAA
jgi:ribosomal protein L1